MRGSAGKNEVSRAQEEAQMAAWKEKRRLQAGDWRAPFTNPVEKNVTTFEAFEHEPGVWRDAASCDAPHRAPMKAIAAARPVTTATCPKHGATMPDVQLCSCLQVAPSTA